MQPLGFSLTPGLVVNAIKPGTQAEERGVPRGVRITRVDGEAVHSTAEVHAVIENAKDKGGGGRVRVWFEWRDDDAAAFAAATAACAPPASSSSWSFFGGGAAAPAAPPMAPSDPMQPRIVYVYINAGLDDIGFTLDDEVTASLGDVARQLAVRRGIDRIVRLEERSSLFSRLSSLFSLLPSPFSLFPSPFSLLPSPFSRFPSLFSLLSPLSLASEPRPFGIVIRSPRAGPPHRRVARRSTRSRDAALTIFATRASVGGRGARRGGGPSRRG
jgi:hypothetical protein